MIFHIKQIQQFKTLFSLSLKLFYRRLYMSLFTLSLPIVALGFLYILDFLFKQFVIPPVDNVISMNNMMARRSDQLINSGMNNVSYLHLMYLMDNVPEKIYYDEMNEVIEGLVNGTVGNYVDFVWNEKNEEYVDELILKNMKKEYDNRNIEYYNDVIGSIDNMKINDDGIKYRIQYEKDDHTKYKLSIAVNFRVETIVNNYSSPHKTKFCKALGFATRSFSCDYFILNFMMGLINHQYIYLETDRIVQSYAAQIPYENKGWGLKLNRGNLQTAMNIPMVILLVLPYLLYCYVYDKKSRELMGLMGLNNTCYFIVAYIFQFLVCFLYFTITYVFGRFVFHLTLFTNINFWLMLIIFVGIDLTIVAFNFLFSVFFSSHILASFIGYFVALAFSTFISSSNEMTIDKGVSWFKLLLFLFPFPIVDTFTQVKRPALYHDVYVGFDFLYKDVDMLLAVISLYVNPILYFILYRYLEQVIPQTFGVTKHWLFFLNCLYPRKNHSKNSNNIKYEEKEDSDVKEQRELIDNMNDDDIKKYSIVVNRLVKKYRKSKVNAVNGISFRIEKGTCFGLLGENGAGKTTTIKILCSLISKSFGDIYINGKNTNEGIKKVRHLISLCPQHSILWEELTINDHLSFYCDLRGIKPSEQAEHIKTVMEATSLDTEKRKLGFWKRLFCLINGGDIVKNLNEGSKRRLALAISLIGNPSILFLDEPTTTLDPTKTKKLWEIILKQKKSRTLILTTHSMVEAEVLADNICILAEGNMKCIGNNLKLKEKFGKGYHLIIKYEKEKKDDVVNLVENIIPVETNRRILKDFNCFLTWEMESKGLDISKVFENLEKKKIEYGIKNWSLHKTSLRDVFLSIISKQKKNIEKEEIIEEDFKDVELKTKEEIVVDVNTDDGNNGSMFETNPFKLFFIQIFAILMKQYLFSTRKIITSVSQIFFPFLIIIMLFFSMYQYKQPNDPIPYPESKRLSLKHEKCVSEYDYCYNFVYTTNGNTFADLVMDEFIESGNYPKKSYRKFDNEQLMISFMKNSPNITEAGISFHPKETILPLNQNYTEYCIWYNRTSPIRSIGNSIVRLGKIKNQIDNSILFVSTGKRNMISIDLKPFPYNPPIFAPGQLEFISTIGPVFFSLSCIFVIINALFFIANEKENNILIFLRINGLNSLPFVIAMGINFSLFCILSSIVAYVSSLAFGFELVTLSAPLLPLLLFILYFLALLSFASIFTVFFSKVSSIFSFVIFFVVVVFFLSFLFDGTLIYAMYNQTKGKFFLYVIVPLLFPPLNFGKIFADIVLKTKPVFNYDKNVYEDNVGYSFGDLFEKNRNIVTGMETEPSYIWFIYIIIDIILYLGIAFLIFFITKRRYPKKKSVNVELKEVKSEIMESKKNEISIKNLKKSFNNIGFSNDVLKDISLELTTETPIVSIIGPNATGKSTLISLIVGRYKISDGDIYIYGKDIKKEFLETRKKIGLLPQNNIFLDVSFTVKETLQIFALIKGIKLNYIKKEIERVVHCVNLYKNINQKIGTFSGGMKRRMALAIALIGSPEILILDESTVGLDPFSKQNIWEVINDYKKNKNKLVLMSTHDMNESEILSDKIAILKEGKIVEFEDALSLKSKYDTGYNISIITKENKEEMLIDYIKRFENEVKLISHHKSYFIYNVSRKHIEKLPSIINSIEELFRSEDTFISNWAISQNDLLDVYNKVIFDNQKDVQQ